MKITTKFLKELKACQEGIDLVATYKNKDRKAVIECLIADGKLDWANWLLPRTMTYKQYVSYAVFAAEQVIGVYEKEYPDDKRPRQAIEAAKRCIENPSEKNKAAAAATAAATATASAAAAAAATAAAGGAYSDASVEIKKKILSYGLNLLKI